MSAVAVKLSERFVAIAKARADIEHRSTAKQVEFWASIGKIADENPEMPGQFIKDTLIGISEANLGQLKKYVIAK